MLFGKRLGEKIKQIARAENISIAKLSNMANIRPHAIYDIINHKNYNISTLNLSKIIDKFPQYTCFILEVDPDELHKQIILKKDN